MNVMTIPGRARATPVFQAMRRPRAYGQGDIADAVIGVATTALQIAAQERAAYLQKKQAEALARVQAAQLAAQQQAAQQAQQQAALQQAAMLEAQRNAAAPSSMGLSIPAAVGGVPWYVWVGGLALAGLAARRALM